MTAPPADVAALLRRYLARLDAERGTPAAVIEALDAYTHRLKWRNMVAGALAGRLRRLAAEYDADAERLRRQSRRVHEANVA
jgi:hypothetical protein